MNCGISKCQEPIQRGPYCRKHGTLFSGDWGYCVLCGSLCSKKSGHCLKHGGASYRLRVSEEICDVVRCGAHPIEEGFKWCPTHFESSAHYTRLCVIRNCTSDRGKLSSTMCDGCKQVWDEETVRGYWLWVKIRSWQLSSSNFCVTFRR